MLQDLVWPYGLKRTKGDYEGGQEARSLTPFTFL